MYQQLNHNPSSTTQDLRSTSTKRSTGNLSSASGSKRRKGAALVMVALMLPIIIGMVAFAVDLGLMVVLRSQIQNAVDAGALAASLTLRADANAIDDAVAAAEQYVQLNRVGSAVTVPANAIEVEVGDWDDDTKTFTATNFEPNAVRVFARQDNESHLFAGLYGHTTFGAPASAIASGSGSALDIMMVLDLSGSMQYEGRIAALRNAAPVFVDVIENIGGSDQIGMMGLSANPGSYDPASEGHSGEEYDSGLNATDDHHVGILEQRLTNDFDALRNGALSSSELTAGKYTGWTGTGAALGDAAHYLENGAEARISANNIIVLMSDGHANRPTGSGPDYARAMAAYAAGLDITVYTISLGNGADLDLMQDIADATGGEHFDATGSGESALTALLTEAFKDVAAAIKRTQIVQ
jgi:Flp pilus assembly protein TadG